MIREAAEGDVEVLIELINELARFERSADSVMIDRDLLHAALFDGSPNVFTHVAEEDGNILGMAIWFLNFSTWTGRNGIYLEDLYVRPEARGRGVGLALISELASIAHRSGYGRVEWSVLDWNEEALRFYRSLGAVAMDEWTGYRLAGPALADLAGRGPSRRMI
ncbi:MAG TPA: GNAT family N-acetyltransferase [Acidimicrobiales bacterium]|nr:GNAT family N-acetyltransferase [Acidimicrobiales bacterium]